MAPINSECTLPKLWKTNTIRQAIIFPVEKKMFLNLPKAFGYLFLEMVANLDFFL